MSDVFSLLRNGWENIWKNKILWGFSFLVLLEPVIHLVIPIQKSTNLLSSLFNLTVSIIFLYLSFLSEAGVSFVSYCIAIGEPVNIQTAYQASKKLFWRIVALTIVLFLIISPCICTVFMLSFKQPLQIADLAHTRSDTAHPFRSAAVVARIMPKLGFELSPNIKETDLEIWSNLVMAAQHPDGERMIHDHSSLKQIIDGIYGCWGKDNSATRVLKAVLLHQSLPTVKEWSNAVLLTDEELSYALTLSDMKVLGALLVADSDSWNIFTEVRSSFLDELRASNAKTHSRIQNMVKIGESYKR